jgi:hypothetical protein
MPKAKLKTNPAAGRGGGLSNDARGIKNVSGRTANRRRSRNRPGATLPRGIPALERANYPVR